MNKEKRIISLVPSLSETICDLGQREYLLGCTKFCVHPKGLHRSTVCIGGTKDPDINLIKTLHPSHIVANQEENQKQDVLALSEIAKVLVTFPKSPYDVPKMLRELGDFLECQQKAESEALHLEAIFASLRVSDPIRFLYLIWQNPYMVTGPDTYISRMLETIGWQSAYKGTERYATLSVDAMRQCNPDIVLMSSEPYPFRKRDCIELKNKWPDLPRVVLVDGQMLSWFGSRTGKALQMMQGDQKSWQKAFN